MIEITKSYKTLFSLAMCVKLMDQKVRGERKKQKEWVGLRIEKGAVFISIMSQMTLSISLWVFFL